jgi:glycerol-3-phosphate dehydrogenase
MGEDAINRAAEIAGLRKEPSRTRSLRLHGWTQEMAANDSARVYGADHPLLERLALEDLALNEPLHPRLPYRMYEVIWAARNEMARTVEDVLARRTRALFLDARAAIEAAPRVADLLARELGRSEDWKVRDLETFYAIARGYVYEGE